MKNLSYAPLFNMLEEYGISKMEFKDKVDISAVTLAKFGKNESVCLSIIEKICKYFDCDIGDVVEYIPDKTELRRIVTQECDKCGKRFKIEYISDGNYRYLDKPCDCESEFHPVDGLSMDEWLKEINRKRESHE